MHLAEGDWSYHANCEVQTSYALVLTPSFHKTWIFSVVYNGHRTMIQKILWKELSSLSFINTPWAIIGDFNSITMLSEHKGVPFRYYASKARLFADFITNNTLLDVEFIGNIYSWCNG